MEGEKEKKHGAKFPSLVVGEGREGEEADGARSFSSPFSFSSLQTQSPTAPPLTLKESPQSSSYFMCCNFISAWIASKWRTHLFQIVILFLSLIFGMGAFELFILLSRGGYCQHRSPPFPSPAQHRLPVNTGSVKRDPQQRLCVCALCLHLRGLKPLFRLGRWPEEQGVPCPQAGSGPGRPSGRTSAGLHSLEPKPLN